MVLKRSDMKWVKRVKQWHEWGKKRMRRKSDPKIASEDSPLKNRWRKKIIFKLILYK
jgi:hypothetical protein